MLVWEILLGTERAQKGARPPRAPPPRNIGWQKALLGKWGEFSLWSLSKRGKRMEYEGTRDWERSQTAAGEQVVGAALAAGWGFRGGGAREAEALTHEPGQRGELLQGVKGPADRPQLTEVPRREESAQQHPCAPTAPRTPSAEVKRELG